MRSSIKAKKQVGMGIVALMTVFLSFTAFGEGTTVQDDWAARMERVQYALESGPGNPVLPSGGNQITIQPETPVRVQTTSVQGNVVYRDGNGTVLDTPGTNGTMGENSDSTANKSSESSVQLSVQESSISEIYYEDYDIYCLTIGGKYHFYSSVGNLGITDQPVSVDIPANMNYTMLKDGVPTSYTSKQTLTDTGSYVFYFTVVRNPKEPVSLQQVFEAEYSFRIQPKAKKTEETMKSTETYEPEDYEGYFGQESVNPYLEWPVPEETTAVPESWGYEESQAEDRTESWTDIQTDSRTDIPVSQETAQNTDLPNGKTDYDYNKEMYHTSFGENLYLYASIPNGIMTNYEVTLDVSGANGSLKLLKDGVDFVLPDDQKLSEPGSYTVLVVDGNITYTYSFRILGDAEKDLDYYTVPEGMELEAFYIEDISQNVSDVTDSSGTARVTFEEDGVYRLVIRDNFGAVFDSELIRDSKAPVVTVQVTGKEAQINYEDRADVAYVVLRSGEEEEQFSFIEQVTKKGNYELDVYDYAGNQTTVTFQVKGRTNEATIISILILVGILAAGIIFYIRTRKLSRDM